MVLAADAHDVGRVPSPSTLRVVRVNGASPDGSNGVLQEPALIERVRVDGDSDVVQVSKRQARVDGARGRPPVLVKLHPDGTGPNNVVEPGGMRRVSLPGERKIKRHAISGLEHSCNLRRGGRARGCVGTSGRAGAAAKQRGDARSDGLGAQLRADEVHVGVKPAGGDDLVARVNHLRVDANDKPWVHAAHHVRVARLQRRKKSGKLQRDSQQQQEDLVDAPNPQQAMLCRDEQVKRTAAMKEKHACARHACAQHVRA